MSHAVQFYHDDIYLIDAVSAFIEAGFQEKATSIVIATPQHREELRARLHEAAGPGIESRMLYFDAVDLLSTFMVDGQPNPTRFMSNIWPILQQATLAGPVRIFGEMVAVLWAQGNTSAAIQLEKLWNELAQSRAFSLLCAYPMSGFPNQNHESYHHVCQVHDQIHPSEQAAH
ncbi:MAG: MEDS domain-containing protein [Nitrospirales bacterium]